jgi:hypothetical protein
MAATAIDEDIPLDELANLGLVDFDEEVNRRRKKVAIGAWKDLFRYAIFLGEMLFCRITCIYFSPPFFVL